MRKLVNGVPDPSWKFQVPLTQGAFYAVVADEEATRAAGIMSASDMEDTAFGLFKGQLTRLTSSEATFLLTDQDMSWKTTVDLTTGQTAAGGVITSIEPIDFNNGGGFPAAALEAAVRSVVERRVKGPAPVIEIRLGKEANAPKVRVKERTHKLFAKLLYYVSQGFNIYLWGPPGTGKTHVVAQVARHLKRSFATLSLNSQTPDSRLFGFVNPVTGKYVATEFHDSYKKGKSVFGLDEADNGTAGILTTLNGMYSSPQGGFPCGTVTMGKDHTLIASGNTCGRGGDDLFPDRWSFDQAFADRFVFIYWDYDEEMERDLALQINPACEALVDWIFRLRAYCRENYPKLFVTPRVTYRMAKCLLDGVIPMEELVEDILFKGFDPDSKEAILRSNPLPKVTVVERKKA